MTMFILQTRLMVAALFNQMNTVGMVYIMQVQANNNNISTMLCS